jgi:hypothetical protein
VTGRAIRLVGQLALGQRAMRPRWRIVELDSAAALARTMPSQLDSWNVVFIAAVAAGAYSQRHQEPFALNTRLHSPTK